MTPAPDPDAIHAAAREVVSRPYYKIDSAASGGAHFFDTLWDLVKKVFSPFMKLMGYLEGVHPALPWIVTIALVVLLVVLITHMVWSFKVAIQQRAQSYSPDVPRRAIDWNTWERWADEAYRSGDYVGAVRHLFRACLGWLESVNERPFRPGVTNREHMRRYRETPIFAPLRLIVETLDLKWYGGESCGERDYAECLAAYQSIRASHAPRAGDVRGAVAPATH